MPIGYGMEMESEHLHRSGVIILQGGLIKGRATSDSEEKTQSFIKEMRKEGATVQLRRKYETFQGFRFETTPKQHKIKWEFR